MSKPKEKQYGIADRAWQCVIGCDPHMSCAPRCWARKTMARIVECQKPENPERAEFYQIALTPDGKQWSGKTYLDEAHLHDPLKWRKPAVIATGFHGDWGRLDDDSKDRLFSEIIGARRHTFLLLTKCPADVLGWLRRFRPDGQGWVTPGGYDACDSAVCADVNRWPLPNVTLGCSVMNQAEADRQREPMAQLAAMGWATHVWYEPAIGPVDWRGWEFLRGVIVGGESGGRSSRPMAGAWARSTRDFCVEHGIPYHFKQWGDWAECGALEVDDGFSGGTAFQSAAGGRAAGACLIHNRWRFRQVPDGTIMERVGKANSGRLLDGREWNEVPEVRA